MIHKKEACEVKRVFKKNQIIIAALAVMIAVAGYFNYSGNFMKKTGELRKQCRSCKSGAARYFGRGYRDGRRRDCSNDSDVEGTPGEAVLTNGSAETTVAQAKVTREQVRAQNKETLQAIIDIQI